MLRLCFSLASLTALCAIASAPILGCFPQASCDAICEPALRVTAHVPVTTASLAGGRITLCRNGACETAVFGAASDAGVVNTATLEGAAFQASVELKDEEDGYTVVEVDFDVATLKLVDGDTYGVTIADAEGATLLNVSRTLGYDLVQSCGTTCHDYTMDLYPTSASNIECGDKTCIEGVRLTGSFTTDDSNDAISLTFCRNSDCGTCTLSIATITGKNVGEAQQCATNGLGSLFSVDRTSNDTFTFEVDRTDDSAALADGDAYTVTIQQAATDLVTWSATVTYSTSWPNGPACDVVPCRSLSVVIQ